LTADGSVKQSMFQQTIIQSLGSNVKSNNTKGEETRLLAATEVTSEAVISVAGFRGSDSANSRKDQQQSYIECIGIDEFLWFAN